MSDSKKNRSRGGGRLLDQVPVGRTYRVESVDDHSPCALRLNALGFLPGREVRLAREAPLGDPIAVDLGGARVGLRRSDARAVRVCHVD